MAGAFTDYSQTTHGQASANAQPSHSRFHPDFHHRIFLNRILVNRILPNQIFLNRILPSSQTQIIPTWASQPATYSQTSRRNKNNQIFATEFCSTGFYPTGFLSKPKAYCRAYDYTNHEPQPTANPNHQESNDPLPKHPQTSHPHHTNDTQQQTHEPASHGACNPHHKYSKSS
jgi:hypothetical protein